MLRVLPGALSPFHRFRLETDSKLLSCEVTGLAEFLLDTFVTESTVLVVGRAGKKPLSPLLWALLVRRLGGEDGIKLLIPLGRGEAGTSFLAGEAYVVVRARYEATALTSCKVRLMLQFVFSRLLKVSAVIQSFGSSDIFRPTFL